MPKPETSPKPGATPDATTAAKRGAKPAAAAPRAWLFKSEPDVFGFDDLLAAPDQTTGWEGVRNYQARNFLRDDVRVGDSVLFYHSNAEPAGVAGIAEVVRSAYPDATALDPASEYHDPRSTPDAPIWMSVDVRAVERFPRVVTLAELRAEPALAAMVVLRRGNRLSVTPVTAGELAAVRQLGRGAAGSPTR